MVVGLALGISDDVVVEDELVFKGLRMDWAEDVVARIEGSVCVDGAIGAGNGGGGGGAGNCVCKEEL